MQTKSLKNTFTWMKIWIIILLAFDQALCQEQNNATSKSRSCKSVFNKPATCKRLEDCRPLLNLIKRHPLVGRHVVESSICSLSLFDVIVCCPKVEEDNNNDTNNKQPDKKPANTTSVSSYKPLQPPQCGYSNAVHDRVVGGNPSALGAWPWIALLGYGESSRYIGFKCGGTLVSSRHVITAGHCILDDLQLVRLGELDLHTDTDGANPIDVLIEKAVTHPEFDEETLHNDIAILKLNKDVQFTDAIHPICLPLPDEVKNRNYVGTFPFVAGWGATRYQGYGSNILREAQVPVVDTAKCKASYRFIQDIDVNTNLCAGYAQGGKDACQGDSGGPLMFPKKSTYYLIGVVSSGYKCAEPGYPGVYTRVASFLDFIQSNMN